MSRDFFLFYLIADEINYNQKQVGFEDRNGFNYEQ